jgi:antitoxin VapB
VSSFAWATCGAASYINTATSTGTASLLITRDGLHLITNNIEATRLEQEEKLKDQGWEFHVTPWHASEDYFHSLARGLNLGADVPYQGALDLGGELALLRATLTGEEGDRFRTLGRKSADAINAAIRSIRPGQTEYEIAAILDFETRRRGVQPIVNLIATDERIFSFRHPLPTGKTLERYAMLVLCGRSLGLVASITRLVYFGRLPEEIQQKEIAVAHIDATLIARTRPGRSLGEVFEDGVAAYAAQGFPGEWRDHHQGGPAGYEPREYLATPASTEPVLSGQVYAWNPSIRGVKSEDSVLVSQAGHEVITQIDSWPVLRIDVDGQEITRPAILEVD